MNNYFKETDQRELYQEGCQPTIQHFRERETGQSRDYCDTKLRKLDTWPPELEGHGNRYFFPTIEGVRREAG